MKFKKLLGKLGSQIKVAGLSLILPLIFTTADSTAAVNLSNPIQPVQNTSLGKDKYFLIAASSQLNLLFDGAVFSTPTVKEKRGYPNYGAAYNSAWGWFTYIITGPIRGPYYSDSAGYIYVGDLIGGGTANIRQRGSSGNYPTIDTLNHYSGVPNTFVGEVKFKY